MLKRLSIPITGCCTILLLYLCGVTHGLSNTAQDLLFRLRGPVAPPQSIVIVGVDETSLKQLGAWPFPRKIHAKLLLQLSQARAVGFDFLFSEPTADDALFNEQLQHAPPVIFASATTFENTMLSPSQGLNQVTGTGHIETIFANDGIVRKVLLNTRSGQQSFSLALLRTSGQKTPKLKQKKPLIINYYGPERTFLYLSYIDVLEGRIPQDFFKDRFVLVGAEAIGLNDTFITPFSHTQVTPGVEVQATILGNLLEQSFLRPLPLPSFFLLALLLIIGATIWPVTGERYNISLNLILLGAASVVAVVCFHYSLFLDIALFSVVLFVTYLLHLLQQTLWAGNAIYIQIRGLNKRLDKGLEQIYGYVPQKKQQLTQRSMLNTLGIHHYITQLQFAADALGMQHTFLDNLLNNELPPLALWDAVSGQPIIANIHFRKFWKHHITNKPGLPNYAAFAKEVFRLQTTNTDQGTAIPLFGLESPLHLEIQVLGSSGRHYFQIDMHRFSAEETPFEGTIAILHDVTQLKELERVKDEIVSIVSHELKLPLTTILGYGEMLAESLDSEQQQYAEIICTEAKRLNQLIVTFLDINRIESGKQQLHFFPFYPLTMIGDAIASVTPAAQNKGIAISPQLPRKTSAISGDELLLLQAVINLLDNAIKFSPENSTITLTLQEQKTLFTLSIEDQGPGIPSKLHQSIFKKFDRGTDTLRQEGFGLGLNLVKEVIDRHHGQITINNKPDKGTNFTLLIPKQTTVE